MGIVGAKRSGSASGGGEIPSQVRAAAMSRIISRAATIPETNPVAMIASRRVTDASAARSGFKIAPRSYWSPASTERLATERIPRSLRKLPASATGVKARRAGDTDTTMVSPPCRSLQRRPGMTPRGATMCHPLTHGRHAVRSTLQWSMQLIGLRRDDARRSGARWVEIRNAGCLWASSGPITQSPPSSSRRACCERHGGSGVE